MAKNVLSLQLLRNSTVAASKEAAITAIKAAGTQDGVIKLARYTDGNTVKTIFGIYNDTSVGTAGYTIYDSYQEAIESIKDDIADLSGASVSGITAVEARLGDGVTSGNTATQQLQALSGDAQSTSADTSVAGAKKYTDGKIDTLDYTGVTTGDAVVITNVTEDDGVVAATTANVGNLKLTDYVSGSSSGDVVATDTINQAFGKIENQIANLESGSSEEIEEIKNSLGTGVTTANTATAQFAALSGTASASSAETSVAGAKAYTNDKIAEVVDGLDYTDTAATGNYVSKVDEVNGVITVTREALPTVADSASAKTFVTSVSENLGEISVSKGTITSSDKTITLTDNADGGVNFAANIDGVTLIANSGGVISVASSALVEYVGDNDTIEVSAAVNNQKTISSLLSIKEVTTSVPDTVAHRYMLAGTGTTQIGEYIDIPKDSALVNFYLGHVDDLLQGTTAQTEESTSSTVVPGTGDTALVWIMQLADGKYKLATVDVHSFIDEAEFASGVTWDATAKKVKGVVDGGSETFLTVGADGFKLSGVQTAIDNAVSGATAQTAALSAKTVTEIASSNSSISATTSTADDGTVSVDLVTDASKVKMTGFTADASGFTGITTASTVTEAVKVIETEFLANEATVSAALNDLEAKKIENIVVNGATGTVANNVATVTISGDDILLTGYQSGATGEVAATDDVDVAISKLNSKIAAAVAGGVSSVNSGTSISISGTNNDPVVNLNLKADAGSGDNDWHNPLKVDGTTNSLYFDSLDCGTY